MFVLEKLCNKSKQDWWNAKCYNILDISVTLSYLKHDPNTIIILTTLQICFRKLCIFYSTQCSPLLLKLFHTDFNKINLYGILILGFPCLLHGIIHLDQVFIEYVCQVFSPKGGRWYSQNPAWGSSFQKGHLFQASKACKREEISQVEIYKRVVSNLTL